MAVDRWYIGFLQERAGNPQRNAEEDGPYFAGDDVHEDYPFPFASLCESKTRWIKRVLLGIHMQEEWTRLKS